MNLLQKRNLTLAMLLLNATSIASAASAIATRPDDPQAVYLTAPGNGKADDSAAIQAAIDKAAGQGRQGIVFIPSGRYRLTHSIYIWPGARVFG